jgi:hypothetical protein
LTLSCFHAPFILFRSAQQPATGAPKRTREEVQFLWGETETSLSVVARRLDVRSADVAERGGGGTRFCRLTRAAMFGSDDCRDRIGWRKSANEDDGDCRLCTATMSIFRGRFAGPLRVAYVFATACQRKPPLPHT